MRSRPRLAQHSRWREIRSDLCYLYEVMRNHYLNHEELEALASDDNDNVRKLVDLLRDLAGERLFDRMRELGRKYLSDPEAPGLDRALWYAVENGPARLDSEEVGDLEQLSQMAGGWWRLDGPEPEFLSFEEWSEIYGAEQ